MPNIRIISLSLAVFMMISVHFLHALSQSNDYGDSDGDGLTDDYEIEIGTNPYSADTDNDKIPDGREIEIGTNPLNPDTDGDGLLDWWEVANVYGWEIIGMGRFGLPTDPSGENITLMPMYYSIVYPDGKPDPLKYDTDGDGIKDGDEYPDLDRDGIDNWVEVAYGTNPLSPESELPMPPYYTPPENQSVEWPIDSNIIEEWLEEYPEVVNLTYPPPTFEQATGLWIPGIKIDTGNDEKKHVYVISDGLTDYEELFIYHTDPFIVDTDGDLLPDSEAKYLGTNATSKKDSDGDGITDFNESIGSWIAGPMLVNISGYTVVQSGLGPRIPYADALHLSGNWALYSNTHPDTYMGWLMYRYGWTDPTRVDTDADGLPDGMEVGYATEELTKNGGGKFNTTGTSPRDPDSDFDGLPDGVEAYISFTDPMLADEDHDGIIDSVELGYGTSPINNDSDSDGLGDGEEVLCGGSSTDALNDNYSHYPGMWGPFDEKANLIIHYNSNAYAMNPLKEDSDSDGLSDLEELKLGLDPTSLDTDADGLSDWEEVMLGSDPLSSDSDGDGLYDGYEVHITNSSPINADSDNDGLSDSVEVYEDYDPLNPDSDGDGLYDGCEYENHSNPMINDTDGDGLRDGDEIAHGTDPNEPDTDGDGVGDGDELGMGDDPLSPNPGDPNITLSISSENLVANGQDSARISVHVATLTAGSDVRVIISSPVAVRMDKVLTLDANGEAYVDFTAPKLDEDETCNVEAIYDYHHAYGIIRLWHMAYDIKASPERIISPDDYVIITLNNDHLAKGSLMISDADEVTFATSLPSGELFDHWPSEGESGSKSITVSGKTAKQGLVYRNREDFGLETVTIKCARLGNIGTVNISVGADLIVKDVSMDEVGQVGMAQQRENFYMEIEVRGGDGKIIDPTYLRQSGYSVKAGFIVTGYSPFVGNRELGIWEKYLSPAKMVYLAAQKKMRELRDAAFPLRMIGKDREGKTVVFPPFVVNVPDAGTYTIKFDAYLVGRNGSIVERNCTENTYTGKWIFEENVVDKQNWALLTCLLSFAPGGYGLAVNIVNLINDISKGDKVAIYRDKQGLFLSNAGKINSEIKRMMDNSEFWSKISRIVGPEQETVVMRMASDASTLLNFLSCRDAIYSASRASERASALSDAGKEMLMAMAYGNPNATYILVESSTNDSYTWNVTINNTQVFPLIDYDNGTSPYVVGASCAKRAVIAVYRNINALVNINIANDSDIHIFVAEGCGNDSIIDECEVMAKSGDKLSVLMNEGKGSYTVSMNGNNLAMVHGSYTIAPPDIEVLSTLDADRYTFITGKVIGNADMLYIDGVPITVHGGYFYHRLVNRDYNEQYENVSIEAYNALGSWSERSIRWNLSGSSGIFGDVYIVSPEKMTVLPVGEEIKLEAAATSGKIVSCTWKVGNTTLAVGNGVSVGLSEGNYLIRVDVETDTGISGSDYALVVVGNFSIEREEPERYINELINGGINASLGTPYLVCENSTDDDGIYKLMWSRVENATLYVLEEDNNSQFSTPTTVYEGNGNNYTITGKNSGTYYYRVMAKRDGENSSWSNVVFVVVEIADKDNDGLPDSWEYDYFGDLKEGAADDYDGDGFTNIQEYESNTDPTDPEDYPYTNTEKEFVAGEKQPNILKMFAVATFVAVIVIITYSLMRKSTKEKKR